ncbi:MAG: NAD(P)H-quinone oxidoreductase [Rhodospirillaceae bacterium]|nr:NAD(P)H-quinone oxidoreductase [Rhodospirillaceae bacterium]
MSTTALPAVMRAVEIKAPGGPEQLVETTRPLPAPGPREVLIRVAAAGVNRPDVVQRLGQYPAPPGASDLPGLEVAGHVVARGSDVARWTVGDAVCALLPGGGYAEFATADEGSCLPVPKNLSPVEAAAIPETFFTVWHNVFERGGLTAGESFLVHGGTSGIGTTAIQLAKTKGAFVIATAGSDEKCAACKSLGADVAVNYRAQDFAEVVRALPGKGVDVILDMVGGDYFPRNVKCLKADGRLVVIAFLKGAKSEIDLGPVMLKRLTITGSTLRARDLAFKAALAGAVERQVWPLLASGAVKPLIHGTFPLAEAAAAHSLMESSAHTGKIVLKL